MHTSVVLFSLVFIAILLIGVMFVLFRQLSTIEKYQVALDDAAEQMLAMSKALRQRPPQDMYNQPDQVHYNQGRIAMGSSVGLPQPGYNAPSQVELVGYPMSQEPGQMSGFSFPQLTPPMTGHIPMTQLPPIQAPAALHGVPQPPSQELPPIPCEKCGAPLQDDLLFCTRCGKTHSSLMFPATGSQPRPATGNAMLNIDPELFPDARTIKTQRPTEAELQSSQAAPKTETDTPMLDLSIGSPLDPSPRDMTRKEAPGAAAASSPPQASELYTREHGRPDELLQDASALLDLAQTPEELNRTPSPTVAADSPVPASSLSPAFQDPRHDLTSSELALLASQGPSNASLTALAQVFPPDIDLLMRATSSYPTAVQVFRPGANVQPKTSPHDSQPGTQEIAHALSVGDFDEALRHAKAYLAIEDDPDNALEFLLGMAINHIEAADSAVLFPDRIDENTVADIHSDVAREDETPLYQLDFAITMGDQFDNLLHRKVPLYKGMLGYCVEERAGLLIDDASLEPSFQQGVLFKADLSLGSFLCVPLLHEEALYGVLLLRNPPQDEPFSLGELHILTYIAHLMAEVLHNAEATILPPTVTGTAEANAPKAALPDKTPKANTAALPSATAKSAPLADASKEAEKPYPLNNTDLPQIPPRTSTESYAVSSTNLGDLGATPTKDEPQDTTKTTAETKGVEAPSDEAGAPENNAEAKGTTPTDSAPTKPHKPAEATATQTNPGSS